MSYWTGQNKTSHGYSQDWIKLLAGSIVTNLRAAYAPFVTSQKTDFENCGLHK